jgi:hypothetical protein
MLKKILGPFREFGLGAGLLYATDRVLSSISPRLRLHVYELMVQPISDKPLLRGSLGRQLEIREIQPGDPEIARMPVRPEIMAQRFVQRSVCLGAFRRDQFIGYMWFCFESYDEDEVRCRYRLHPVEQAVFDFDFYLFPEHRMGLGFVGLWNGANEYLTRRGIKYTFSRLTRFNLASRRSHQHLGWKVAGRALFLQAWRLELMLATVFPYVSLTAGGSKVHLDLRPDVLLRGQSATATDAVSHTSGPG